ncbi:MAG: hypothetical protein IPI29_03085 [Ignavibacteria bacterium]|nr:hypothetical protein [Ignavibacteria bacterium]
MNQDLETYLQAKFGHYADADHGFCKWYIRARFGKKVKAHYTDKSGDGGFDAIVEDDGFIYIIQSKYSQVDPPGRIPKEDLLKFVEDVERIRGSNKHRWEEHVKTLRADLKRLYNETREKVRSKKYDCRYILVTNKCRSDDEIPEYIEVEDVDNITPLWNLYSLDFTPTSKPIKLSITQYFSKKVGNTQSYVGLASLGELKGQLDN